MTNQKKVPNKIRILEAGLIELSEKGFANFTIQGVSERVKISLGNLTYHYPNRESLIEAMLEFWFENWKQEFESQVMDFMNGEPPDIGDFIDWVMDQAVYPQNVAIFTQLWAFSSHDIKVAAMMENLYSTAVRTVTEAFGLKHDDPASIPFQSQLYVLAAISEGSAAVFGNIRPNDPKRKIIKVQARKLLEKPLREALEVVK